MKKFFRLVSMLAVAGLTFTYTSCTDYSEDINKVDGRVDDLQSQFDAFKSATNESIEKINGLVADLQKTVATLETKEDHQKDVDALNKLIEGLKSDATELAGRVSTIEKDLPNYVKKTDLTETLNGYVTVSDFNTKIGEITGRLDVIESKLNPLAAKYDSDLKISEIISKIDAVKATADDASQKVGVLRTDVDVLQKALEGYTSAGAIKTKFEAIEDYLDNKLDIAKFKEEFDKYFNGEFNTAFKTAIEISCKENGDVYKAIHAALDPAVEGLNDRCDDLSDALNDVLGIVLNRIQSIVFVPEYDDMNATVHYYYVGAAKTPVSNEKIVEASFDVYPAKLANTITEDNASVVAVTVGSRAEAANEADKTIITPDATIKGRINVKAKFTTGVNCDLATGKAPFAISLRVMEDTKKPINGNEVEIGNYIESSFVGVKLANDCDLTNAYCIYDFINHKEITAAELATEKAWSVSEDDALFTPFKNYSIGLKFGTQYMTIEDAAEYLNVSEDKITPALSQKATYYNKSNASTPAFSKYYKLEPSAEAEQLKDYSITMTAEAKKVAELTNSVGSSCKNEITAKVNGVVISNISKAISYKIVNRKATITVDPYTVDWTYDNAVKLSTAPTTTDPDWKPYVKPIDKTFKEVLNELRAELTYNYDETKDDPALKLDLKKVLLEADGVTKRTPTDRAGYNVTNDNTRGAALTNAPVLDIDPLAFINGKLASVSITNYKTWFTGKTYELVNTYANPATYTDVEVSMKLTLGLCPESKEIQLGKTELVFKPGAATENALSKDPVTEAFATVPAGAFNDVAQFKESLTDWFEYNETPGIAADAPTWNANRPKVWRTDVNPKAPVSPEWTLLVPFDGTKSYIRLSQADVTSFKNTYEFETAFQTWYGPKYTFKATGSIKPVAYKLDYHRDLVTIDEDGNASVTLKGKKDASTGDIYKILTDDLSKYFGLTGEGFGAASTNLKVVYSVETVTDVAKGYDNIPTVSGTPKAVASDGGIDKEDIDWGTYTARDLKVKATLTYGGKEIDAKELTLNIEDPISFKTDVEGNVYAENRVPYQKVVVNLWKHLVVNSILSPEYNQLNQSVTVLAASSVFPYAPDVWQSRAQAGYDLALEFELVDDSVKVGGEVTPLPSTKLVFDAEKGTLTYNDDSAHMVKDVEAMVKVTLKHKFNYDNKAPKLGEDYIYITVKIAEN